MAVTGTGTQVLTATAQSDVISLGATDKMMVAGILWAGVVTAADDVTLTASIEGQSVTLLETKGQANDNVYLPFDSFPCGFAMDSVTVTTLDSGRIHVYLK